MVFVLVKLPAEYELEDIGEFDFKTTIPAPKNAKCGYCGNKITGSCIIGVKKGNPLYLFHTTGCLDQGQLFTLPKNQDIYLSVGMMGEGIRICHFCGKPRRLKDPNGGFNKDNTWLCEWCKHDPNALTDEVYPSLRLVGS